MLIVFSGNSSRSMYQFRLGVMKKFQDHGYTVIAIAPEDDFTEKLIAEKITVVILKEMEQSGTNPLKENRLYKEYLSLYKKLKPNVIFHYTIKPNIYGTIAANKLKIPNVAVVTGLGYTFIHKGVIPYLVKKMYRFAFKKASQIWFLNNDDKLLFEEKKIVSFNKSFVLNSEGIDTKQFPFEAIDPTKKSFIFIGRLLYDKGVREYFEAARILKIKYPDVQFKILGYLNVENPMAISEKQMKLWVDSKVIEYLGSTSDVRPFIKSSTCVVLPSYREGISVTLMEGAAMGRPLIASNITGCKELITDKETGYLCEAKNINDLAAKMETFINLDQGKIDEMGRKSREKVDQFSIEKIIPIYQQEVNNLLN